MRNAFSLVQLFKNMGIRYVVFRIWYMLQIKTGWLKIRFPKHTRQLQFVSLETWHNLPVQFFSKIDNPGIFKDQDFTSIKNRIELIHQNKFLFFSSNWFTVTDWHTNPETGFTYESNRHWSEIPDFFQEAGDIKYIWEKSRFTFLYDLIRYDFHFQKDQSRFVFDQIESWINSNPVNCGPNWKCGQEITLRVLNWTFALQYYKGSLNLTEQVFDKIINSIYRQMQHVEHNINFSRIAVRNNHALTETLGLYLTGLFYPFFPEGRRWKKKGREWFEKEIAYQIYEDGTFLQFSMNYHRVVIQLLTWALKLAALNEERWCDTVYNRVKKSIYFLRSCQDDKTGWLPNYGNNDGALFFPLTECHFRDFRPQLGSLADLLNIDLGYEPGIWQEEMFWLGGGKEELDKGSLGHGIEQGQAYILPSSLSSFPPMSVFPKSGYYVLRDSGMITFLRCGSYKDRPFQADNLHLDIWVNGENILRDTGSYKYNTDEKWSRYFMGTAGHNTVILGDSNQMRKGAGFVWYDWIRKAEGSWKLHEGGKDFVFEGHFEAFRQVGKGIKHTRKVRKKIGELFWEIEDQIENAPNKLLMKQLWHPSDIFFEQYSIHAFDENDDEIPPLISTGWYSGFYGEKEESKQITFISDKRYIRTVIRFKVVQTV